MSIGIRGFTIGYDFYAPERSVCFHHYAEGKNAKARNKGMLFRDPWGVIKYRETDNSSPFRLILATHLSSMSHIFVSTTLLG